VIGSPEGFNQGAALLKFAERGSVHPKHPVGRRRMPVLAQCLAPMPTAGYPAARFRVRKRSKVYKSDKNSDTERVQSGQLDQ